MTRPAFAPLAAVAALFAAAPAVAVAPPGEISIPNMSRFLDWRPDGNDALFVQAENGRWYHVRLRTACPRMAQRSNVRFNASPTDRFDKYSSIRAAGWRCLVDSIAESSAPPRVRRGR
jgi:hypothetical protein